MVGVSQGPRQTRCREEVRVCELCRVVITVRVQVASCDGLNYFNIASLCTGDHCVLGRLLSGGDLGSGRSGVIFHVLGRARVVGVAVIIWIRVQRQVLEVIRCFLGFLGVLDLARYSNRYLGVRVITRLVVFYLGHGYLLYRYGIHERHRDSGGEWGASSRGCWVEFIGLVS